MHGRKKFIVLEGGRIKRCRHRHTSYRAYEEKDERRRLERRMRWLDLRDEIYQEALGRPYPYRHAHWEEHRPWRAHDGGRWDKAPRWMRNQLEKRFRARVRDLMAHGRYDELQRARRKDADWLWN